MRSAPFGLKASVVSIPSEHLEQVNKGVAAECTVPDFDKRAFVEIKTEDDTESTDTDYGKEKKILLQTVGSYRSDTSRSLSSS